MGSHRTIHRWRPALLPFVLLLALALAMPTLGAAQTPGTLVPVGGGYTNASLQEFSRVVIEQASAPEVDIYVLPSSYGDDPADRDENIGLAQDRTDQIEAQCEIVLVEYSGFTGCTATLLILFDREDAMNPDNSAALYEAEGDGVWILGGDQTIAMNVLASSPAETALEYAYDNGVVFGGTSAGAAVLSETMLAGYTDPGWPYNALERPMIVVWWSNDGDDERGLIFASDEVIWDQHFYERGRFTRLFNVVAQSDEQFGGASKLGVGIDWGTGVVLHDDSILTRVFGETSVALVDFESGNATHSWVGERETLSARDVVTHIMPAGDAYTYDVQARAMAVDGVAIGPATIAELPQDLLRTRGRGALILGGDLLWDDSAPVWEAFLSRTAPPSNRPVPQRPRFGQGPSGHPITIIAAGYGTPAENRAAGDEYAAELRAHGWQGEITVLTQTDGAISHPNTRALISSGAGVVLVGGDQSLLDAALANDQLRSLVQHAVRSAPVVLTDGGFTALMGEWYVHAPEPASTSERQTVASTTFLEGGVEIRSGLGIVQGASFQALMTYNQHWGRAYQLSMADPDTIVFGISELTAILIEGTNASVIGERSVIAFDGRGATFTVGENGAIGAFNVVVDLFAEGDVVE